MRLARTVNVFVITPPPPYPFSRYRFERRLSESQTGRERQKESNSDCIKHNQLYRPLPISVIAIYSLVFKLFYNHVQSFENAHFTITFLNKRYSSQSCKLACNPMRYCLVLAVSFGQFPINPRQCMHMSPANGTVRGKEIR